MTNNWNKIKDGRRLSQRGHVFFCYHITKNAIYFLSSAACYTVKNLALKINRIYFRLIFPEFKVKIHRLYYNFSFIHFLSCNLSLIGAFTWLTPPESYRATTCNVRELTLDHIQYIHFCPHKDPEGLPGWGVSSMPGPPPRQHEHETRFTPFTHPFILTRRIWKDDYDGQIIFGDLVGLKLPDICLIGEEKPP